MPNADQFFRLARIAKQRGWLGSDAEVRAFLLGCAAAEREDAWELYQHTRKGSARYTEAKARLERAEAAHQEVLDAHQSG